MYTIGQSTQDGISEFFNSEFNRLHFMLVMPPGVLCVIAVGVVIFKIYKTSRVISG